jgi:hypothetical protein
MLNPLQRLPHAQKMNSLKNKLKIPAHTHYFQKFKKKSLLSHSSPSSPPNSVISTPGGGVYSPPSTRAATNSTIEGMLRSWTSATRSERVNAGGGGVTVLAEGLAQHVPKGQIDRSRLRAMAQGEVEVVPDALVKVNHGSRSITEGQ